MSVDGKSRLRELPEPAVFLPDVAKQHVAVVFAFGVLMSARAGFRPDE